MNVKYLVSGCLGLLLVTGVLFTGSPAKASSVQTDEQRLAERYAPVIKLSELQASCDEGNIYKPTDVNNVFDQSTVALRGPWNPYDLVAIGPSSRDVSSGLLGYHLDFPGSALSPECNYIQWQQHITGDQQPTVYAHIGTEPSRPGELSLQYWIFYVFNEWNNLHEGDWEMIQLNFSAATATKALDISPSKVGYSQHEGAEAAEWGSEKLQIIDRTHPVVLPAAGSHANFYQPALYLGSSASEGVGCDDTRSPQP